MLDAALENLYAHANGVKMSQYEAEEVRVHVARGPSHGSFIFHHAEIKAFLATPEARHSTFNAMHMDGWGSDVEVLERYLNVLNIQALFHVGNEVYYYMKHKQCAHVLGWRGDAISKRVFAMWGGQLPPTEPSDQRHGKYKSLVELLQPAISCHTI